MNIYIYEHIHNMNIYIYIGIHISVVCLYCFQYSVLITVLFLWHPPLTLSSKSVHRNALGARALLRPRLCWFELSQGALWGNSEPHKQRMHPTNECESVLVFMCCSCFPFLSLVCSLPIVRLFPLFASEPDF